MNKKDILIAAAVIVLWGLSFLFSKLALLEMPPLMLGTLRIGLTVFPAVLFLKKPQTRWYWLALYGLLISFGQFALLFAGISAGMSSGLAALLVQMQAFFTVLGARLFFGESLHLHHLTALLTAAAGLALIGFANRQGNLPPAATLLLISAAASWGAGNLVVKTIGRVQPLALVAWGSISAFAAFLVSSLWQYGGANVWHYVSSMSPRALLSVLFLAYAAGLTGYGGWGALLSRHPAAKIAPLSLLVPVVALAAGFVLLNEQLNLWHLAGIAAVMGGLTIQIWGNRRISR